MSCFPKTPFNPLNAELNPICHLLALLGVHHFLHVSRIRVNRLLLVMNIRCFLWLYEPNFHGIIKRILDLKGPRCIEPTSGVHNFSRKVGYTQNYRCRNGNIKQVPFWGPTNIRRHRSKFSSYDDRAPLCTPGRMCCVLPFGVLAFPGTISHFVASQTDVMARRQFSRESLTIISLWYYVRVSGISCDTVCIWKQQCRCSLASVEDSVTR